MCIFQKTYICFLNSLNVKKHPYLDGFPLQKCYHQLWREKSYPTIYFLSPTDVRSPSYDLFCVSGTHIFLWDKDTLSFRKTHSGPGLGPPKDGEGIQAGSGLGGTPPPTSRLLCRRRAPVKLTNLQAQSPGLEPTWAQNGSMCND